MLRLIRKIFGDKYDRHMKKPNHFYANPVSEECWNLDLSFIEFIIPRLKMFKEEASKTIVYDFTIIDKILEGFELYRHIFDWDTTNVEIIKDNYKKVQESMDLFSKHWMEFGW